MQDIASFYKVSFNQFIQDAKKTGFVSEDVPEELIKTIWEKIKIPVRATSGSAGYDFYLPFPFSLREGVSITIPTGIRADIQPGWFLMLVPRSGLGFKHGMRLANTCGIIDSDYFFGENEGHIMARIEVEKNMCLQDGDRFIQGLFIPHGTVRNDAAAGVRTGGFGSTGVK